MYLSLIRMNFKFFLLVSCMLPLVPQEEQPTSDGDELYAQTILALSLFIMALQQAVYIQMMVEEPTTSAWQMEMM